MSEDAPRSPAPVSDSDLAVARGVGVVAGGSLFSSAVRLVIAVVAARVLGADDYGLYVLAVTVAFAASGLASLGLHLAAEGQIAVYRRRGDEAGARGVLRFSFVASVLAAFVAAGLLVLFADDVASGVFDEPAVADLLRISGLATPVLVLTTFLAAVIRGFKRMEVSTLAEDVLQPVSRALLVGVLAFVGMTATRMAVVFTASYAVALLYLLWAVDRRLPFLRRGRPSRQDRRELVTYAFPYWMTGVLRVLRTRIQPLLLGAFGAVANVGVFSVITSANTVGRLANASIRKALRPRLAELHDLEDGAELSRIYVMTTRWTLAANLPIFVLMVLVPESLLSIFGPRFEVGARPLMIVATAELANAATGMCGPIISMSKLHRAKVVISTFWMVVSIAFNVALIPLFGLDGAAIAILVATVAVNGLRVTVLWQFHRLLPWDPTVWKPVAAAAVATGVGVLLLLPLPAVLSFPVLMGFSGAVVLTFLGTLYGLGLARDDQMLVADLVAVASRRVRRALGSPRQGAEV